MSIRPSLLNLLAVLLAGAPALASFPQQARAATGPAVSHEVPVQWVTAAVKAPRLKHRTFMSAAVRQEVSYHIYLPEAYEARRAERFPVLYWLHGRGADLKALPAIVKHFDEAIQAGRIRPIIVVLPNGMATSMWCDSKDGTVPMETVLIKDLIPHIDQSFRTIPKAGGRMVEGFSMGGYGAARLGLKHHRIFRAASILGAGPMQREFTARIGPRGMARVREQALKRVYGGDQAYFRAQSPWVLAESISESVRGKLLMRVAVGDRDSMLPFNRDFVAHLKRLKIPHAFDVVPNVGHHPISLFKAMKDRNWAFYRKVFGEPRRSSGSGPSVLFLAAGKAMVSDSIQMQKKAAESVRKVASAARKFCPECRMHLLVEDVITIPEYRLDRTREKVTGEIFRKALRQLAETAEPQDTVFIYTHSHGRKNGFEKTQPFGGLVMDLPIREPEHRGTMLWDQYVDLLLKIPAKNVVVMTMSCFSGGLAEHMNSPKTRARWKDRLKQGRNLVVLTSQNGKEASPPIFKEGTVVNPFTYAVAKALSGAADGFALDEGKPAASRKKDGRITAGELVDFVLHVTASTPSDRPRFRNIAKPAVAGVFDRHAVVVSSLAIPTKQAEKTGAAK